jgi:predicted ester cyclase
MGSATIEANEDLVRRYFEAVNNRNQTAYKATLADDFSYGDIEGPDEMAENEWRWVDAMDLTWHIEELYAGEGFVTTRARATGTHRGEILGLEPTGESFEVTALMLSVIEDGEIVEWFGEWDFAGILNQIGAIDSPVYD